MKVEGAADARVGDHRGEDLRAVDLFALKGADCYNLIFHMDDDPYLIIVADAADAVSVNFSGRCKFLQI